MAITKMVAVTLSARLENFERIAQEYICGNSIHLENAMSVLGDTKRLFTFDETQNYDGMIKTCEDILKTAGMQATVLKDGPQMSVDEMERELELIAANVEKERERTVELTKMLEENINASKSLESARNIDSDLSLLFNMKFINAKFGHMPTGAYKMLNTYLSDIETVFIKTDANESEVWGIYFAPASKSDEVNEIFDSLYFERVFLPGDISGTPAQIRQELAVRNEKISAEINEIKEKTQKLLDESKDKLLQIYSVAKLRQQLCDVTEKAARSKEFFYIVGWMSEKDAKEMKKKASDDKRISMFYTEKAESLKNIISPPTKLKNNILFRPFEFFVKMYGLPGYNEFDPTPLLAITYILFFGMMFGDVGQSAVFAIAGFLIYKFKKIDLANIIGICGLSGMIFGVLYGSVFGKEDIIKGILPPMDNITTLLITTVAMGAFIIIIGMLLNIKNCFDRGDMGELLFGQNGIAGLIFYVSVIIFALSKIFAFARSIQTITLLLILISLIVIFMKEPLTMLISGEKKRIPKSGMFYVQSFFELFEVLLSYFSNTISFLRIGAFAIVHVGMMMAVEMLASGGTVKTVIVSVLGNAIVMIMEGLVVGIQVLRLEYYEMFSRYFTGNGKPFNSLKIK